MSDTEREDERRYSDVQTLPPVHPGKIMKRFLMDRLGMSERDVAGKSGISSAEVARIAAGDQNIDKPLAQKLAGAFGAAAESLWKMQVVFDHFQSEGRRPPPREVSQLRL
jgi:addiction module HigA family antidote